MSLSGTTQQSCMKRDVKESNAKQVLLKQRLMNLSGGESAGALVSNMVKNEGMASFYKGFSANFMRLGSWNCVMFVTLE